LHELPGRAMSVMEARSARVLDRVLEDPRLAPRRGGSRLRSTFAALRVVLRTGAPPVVIRALARPAAARVRLLREIDALAEIDLGLPRWSEDPAHLLGALANYQRLDDAAVAPDAQFARGAREAEAALGDILARVHGPRRVLAAALLRRVRQLLGLREMPK